MKNKVKPVLKFSDYNIPDIQTIMKIGSILVHIQEMLSSKGHNFDKIVIESLIEDEKVKSWLKILDDNYLLPKKR